MKFLVTGATSGLGRNAVEWLIGQGYQVHATGRNLAVGEQLRFLGAQFTAMDLIHASDQEYQTLLHDCNIIWHCAALSSPWGRYNDFYQSNVVVTSRLANWAGKLGIKRFIHVSSPSIYFDFKHHLDIDENYLPKRFANHYARTKFMAEKILQQHIINFPETFYIIIRPRGLFGAHDRVIIPRVISQIIRTQGKLHLPGGGKNQVDLTFALNVVYALFLASINSNLSTGDIFNITNQQPTQLSQLLNQLFSHKLQLNYQIHSLPYSLLYGAASLLEGIASISKKEPVLTRYSVGTLYFDMTLSQQRAINRLGYIPPYSLQEGIEQTANWLQCNGRIMSG